MIKIVLVRNSPFDLGLSAPSIATTNGRPISGGISAVEAASFQIRSMTMLIAISAIVPSVFVVIPMVIAIIVAFARAKRAATTRPISTNKKVRFAMRFVFVVDGPMQLIQPIITVNISWLVETGSSVWCTAYSTNNSSGSPNYAGARHALMYDGHTDSLVGGSNEWASAAEAASA
jgi:hypothetical protein